MKFYKRIDGKLVEQESPDFDTEFAEERKLITMNQITKTVRELLKEAKEGAGWTQEGNTMVGKLLSQNIALLEAVEKNLPEAKLEKLSYPAIPSNSERSLFNQAQGYNRCLSQIHSIIQESINELKN